MHINKTICNKDRYRRIIAQLLLIIFLFENCNGSYVTESTTRVSATETQQVNRKRNLPGAIDLLSLNATQGMIIQGGGNAGSSVSGAGDVNGDGIADVIIGALYANTGAGVSYVVYGNNNLGSPVNLSSLNGTQGVIIQGVNAHDNSGHSVSGAGDINGDGIDDVIIEAPSAGASYVVYGSKFLKSPISLASLQATQGVVIKGSADSANFNAAYSVSGAGDINGDGIDDVIMGDGNLGNSYVVYGSKPVNTTTSTDGTTSNSTTTEGITNTSTTTEGTSTVGDSTISGITASISAASSTRPLWFSPKEWYASFKAFLAQPTVEEKVNPAAESLVNLHSECKELIVKASQKTADKWYLYRLEDLQQEMGNALEGPEKITKKEVEQFKGRLERIDHDFLGKPLLGKPSSFEGIQDSVEINSPCLVKQSATLLQVSMLLLGNSSVATPAIGN